MVETFNDTLGKFSNNLGNVALIDCHYLSKLITLIQVDFCNVTMTVNGVLKNQVDVYTKDKSEMDAAILQVTNSMMNQVGLNSNITTTTPLKSQIQTFNLISVLMNTVLGTIVAFLAILCIQLNYSLMLSDVDAKTYEFGMLRALGYNKKNVMTTVLL